MLPNANEFVTETIQYIIQLWSTIYTQVINLLTAPLETIAGDWNRPSLFLQLAPLNELVVNIAFSILILVWLIGLFRNASSYVDMKRPTMWMQQVTKLVVIYGFLLYSDRLITSFFSITRWLSVAVVGKISLLTKLLGDDGKTLDPTKVGNLVFRFDDYKQYVTSNSWLGGFQLLRMLFTVIFLLIVVAMGFMLLYTIYMRFIRIFILTTFFPVGIAFLGSETSAGIGRGYIKMFLATLAECLVIILAMSISLHLAPFIVDSLPLLKNLFEPNPDSFAMTNLLRFIFRSVIIMGIVVGGTKMSDNLAERMFAGNG